MIPAVGIEEQILVSSAVALDVVSITRPVKVGNEGVMGLADCDLVETFPLALEDIDVVIVGSDS